MPKKTASGNTSDAWSNFERAIAAAYRDAGFVQARRKTRTDNGHTSIADWDVAVPEVPGMVDDMKYRAGGWSHHGVFEREVHDRYLKGRDERFGVMHTKGGNERGSFVVTRLQTWTRVLAKAYLRNGRSDSWGCPRCGVPVVSSPGGMLNLVSYSCPSCGLAFLSEDQHASRR